MPHPGAQPSRETSAYSTRFQPASESTPACVCLSLPEAATEACPYHHPSSAHLLYLSAGTLPSIHSSPPFGERTRWKGRKKKIRQAKKSTENDYSCWGQADLTSNENTQEYPERHKYSTTHSVGWVHCAIPSTGFFESHRLCGGPSKHIFIQFHWKDLRLLREVVFEVISLCPCILYCAVMTWVTQ